MQPINNILQEHYNDKVPSVAQYAEDQQKQEAAKQNESARWELLKKEEGLSRALLLLRKSELEARNILEQSAYTASYTEREQLITLVRWATLRRTLAAIENNEIVN